MKICWDNLEGLRYIGQGRWRKGYNIYVYKEACRLCGEPFIGQRKNEICTKFCANKGKNNPQYGRKGKKSVRYGMIHSEETKKRISRSRKGKCSGEDHPMWGKHHTEETKKKLSDVLSNIYSKKDIPLYDVFVLQLDWCEPVRRNQEDPNILEIKCTWCGRWYIPTVNAAHHRSQYLKGNYNSESRFYCSDGCKQNCPIYGKRPETLIREDAVRAGRHPWWELNREIQPELRKMVFKRDGWECIKCGSNKSLHCHHLEGIRWAPLESADIDQCITVCKECHKKIHKKDGCGYHEMVCN